MGRDWVKHIRLDWKDIGVTMLDTTQAQLKLLLEKYSDVFKDELGTMNSLQANFM